MVSSAGSISARSIGQQRQRLEAEHVEGSAGDLARLDKDEILDPDAVFARLVIAGLVGEHHRRAQRLHRRAAGVIGRGNALRAFVHREIGADAVAGAMGIVEAGFPERTAREAVDLAAQGAVREDSGGDARYAP